jgi:hypothetical protein
MEAEVVPFRWIQDRFIFGVANCPRVAEASLGKLLEFDRRGRPSKRRPFQPGDGQVVMFTGVRYQRAVAATSETTTPPPAKPRRKRG